MVEKSLIDGEREREKEREDHACGVYQDLCNRIMKKSLVRRNKEQEQDKNLN